MLNTAVCIYFLNSSLGGIKNIEQQTSERLKKDLFPSWEINEIV